MSAILFSCQKSENNSSENDSKLIAKINSSKIYMSDLEQLKLSNLSKADSVAFVKNFINKWAKNEIFYQQALNYLSEDELNIDKELENYKKELISFKFQSKLINEKLDTNITLPEIEEYYNANSQFFLLKNNIVKVLYIKVPSNIPNIEKLKKLFYSNSPSDAEQLNSLCIQYANNYFMNDNTWLMYDDLKKEIPQLEEVPEYTLKTDKTFEFSDDKSFYFLRIIDIKTKDNLSPLNFEKTKIKNMLINQGKQKLINNIKKDFFEKAKTNKELEIYN
jgi:hypothetical protein